MKMLEYILLIIYKIMFDFMYINIISVQFEYMGMYKDINFFKYIIGWIIFFIIVFTIQKTLKSKISLYITKLFLIFSIIPQISLWGIKDYSNTSIILMNIYWIIFIFFLKLFDRIKFKKRKAIDLRDFREVFFVSQLSSKVSVVLILLFSCMVIILISWKYTGFRFVLSFDNIYEYRQSYNEATKSIIVNYLLPLTASVLLPYCFTIHLIERKYVISAIILILGILSFSISGMKTWLFIYVAVVFFCICGKRTRINVIEYLLLFLIGFTCISVWWYYIKGSIELVGLHNRMLSYPSELNFYYYNFFSQNKLLYLRESILRHFFQSPYEIKTPYLVSYTYGSGEGYTNNAVNGLFGDAYANFGLLGTIIYPILLAIIMRGLSYLFESYSDKRYAYSILFIVIWNSLNTSFFTWLLTGGVILFYIVLYINRMELK